MVHIIQTNVSMTLNLQTDFDVYGCSLVHPHRKNTILVHNSDLIKQLVFQGHTVKLLKDRGHSDTGTVLMLENIYKTQFEL